MVSIASPLEVHLTLALSLKLLWSPFHPLEDLYVYLSDMNHGAKPVLMDFFTQLAMNGP